MKIVLLAGGKSERIKPFLEKPLLKFCGKTLIRHQLEILAEAGGKDFLIIGSPSNIHYLKEEGAKFLSEIPWVANEQLTLDYAEQRIDEGSAGALKSAEGQLGENGIMLVSSNDILEISAYRGILETMDLHPGCSVVLGQKVQKYFPGGYLMVGKDDELLKIVEKPGEGNEPSDLINIVAHYHPDSIKMMEFVKSAKSATDDLYETALQMMLDAGHKVKVSYYSGKWQAIKYPWHIFDAAKMLFEKELRMRGGRDNKRAVADDLMKADSAVIKGDVIIESGVKIFEHAVVAGPAYLGKGCVVANGAVVRESFLGDGCVAGYATEIARSYLAEQVWTHSNYVGDSVIGENVSFGAGTVTGNLRLDEGHVIVNIKGEKINSGRQKLGVIAGSNIRCGVNVSLMPGVKIGSNTMIGAGLVIAEDIEDGKYVCGEKGGLVIKENLATIPGDRSKLMEKLSNSNG